MSSSLNLFEEKFTSYAAWIVDGDEGARVGQEHGRYLEDALTKAKLRREFEEYEYFFIEAEASRWAAKNTSDAIRISGSNGYEFDSPTMAKKFLVAMRAARKLAKISFDSDVALPDWAEAALAAGWKMPKGWKP